MSKALLAPAFLFHFATPCRYRKELWAEGGIKLREEHRLPSFGELEGSPQFADLRGAWNEEGLAFVLQVAGKQQAPWCRASRVEDSDGLQVFLNTRDAQNIHRASRFCHRFVFLPSGGEDGSDQPVAEMVKINRAQQSPKAIRAGLLRVQSAQREGGYSLHAYIPAAALTGFDPVETRRLGFSYAVIDRELGWQTFSVGPEFPFQEDPCLWGALELER